MVVFAGLGIWLGVRGANSAWFCEAAQDPNAYEGEWFYTLEQGPDGWLFRHDDLREGFTVPAQTSDALSRLNGVLQQRGVTLIVVAQPPRGVVLQEVSTSDYGLNYDSDAAARRYEEARANLLDAGLLIADLATPARTTPGYFFKRDHHWTPEGAEASAQAAAVLIRATAAYSSLTPRAYRTERVAQPTQVGSYGEAVGRICGQDPPAERFTHYQTRLQGGTENVGAGQNLFGDVPGPPIALAGTSNSASEEFNFAGFLAQETGLEVLNVSAVGGGPEAALSAYLRSSAFTEAPPPFLVWEFATLFDLPSQAVFYRQLIPSATGACSVSESLQNTTQSAAGGTLALFQNVDSDNPDPPRFLYLEATDLSLVNFGVDVTYQNGQTETVRLERPTRTANNGRFFFELTGAVSSLSLTLPEGVGGEITARLCPSA